MKIDAIARRILGWKLNRWDRWYDNEKGEFIPTSDFQPEENIEHAMLIVNRLQNLGFSYNTDGKSRASFNEISETGETLAEAITNAAYSIIERSSSVDTSRLWNRLC